MKNLEVDIYLNQFITFFTKNPKELTDLIGLIDKDLFFNKVREQCIKNLDNDDDVSLSKKQLIDLLVSLNQTNNPNSTGENVQNIVVKTKYGDIFLN